MKNLSKEMSTTSWSRSKKINFVVVVQCSILDVSLSIEGVFLKVGAYSDSPENSLQNSHFSKVYSFFVEE